MEETCFFLSSGRCTAQPLGYAYKNKLNKHLNKHHPPVAEKQIDTATTMHMNLAADNMNNFLDTLKNFILAGQVGDAPVSDEFLLEYLKDDEDTDEVSVDDEDDDEKTKEEEDEKAKEEEVDETLLKATCLMENYYSYYHTGQLVYLSPLKLLQLPAKQV